MRYQLIRTSPYLGGQIRWDIPISSHYEDGVHVVETSGLHIVPLNDDIQFLEDGSRDCLAYRHVENMKHLYRCIGDDMYSAEGEWKGRKWLYNGGNILDPFSHIYTMGCRRTRFSRYSKQFAFLLPLWISEETDAGKFSFVVDVKVDGEERDHVAREIIRFSPEIASYMNEYLQHSPRYLDPDVSMPVETRSVYQGVTDNVLNIKFNPDEAFLSGVNIEAGQYEVKDISYVVPNILHREYPMMEFDNLLLSQFPSQHMVAQQLINLNFLLNLEDISYFLKSELVGKAITIAIQAYYDGSPLPTKDLYTNYTHIPVYRADRGEFDKNMSVTDYMQDPLILNYVHANKFTQPIFHWTMVENPGYIYNFYNGFAPLFWNRERNEMHMVSGRYFDQADISQPTHDIYNGAAGWAKWVDMSDVRSDYMWEYLREVTEDYTNFNTYSEIVFNFDSMILYLNNNRYDMKKIPANVLDPVQRIIGSSKLMISNILLPALDKTGEMALWGMDSASIAAYNNALDGIPQTYCYEMDGKKWSYNSLKERIYPQTEAIKELESKISEQTAIIQDCKTEKDRLDSEENELKSTKEAKITEFLAAVDDMTQAMDDVLEYVYEHVDYQEDSDEPIVRYRKILWDDNEEFDMDGSDNLQDAKPTPGKIAGDMSGLQERLVSIYGDMVDVDWGSEYGIWYTYMKNYSDACVVMDDIYKEITGSGDVTIKDGSYDFDKRDTIACINGQIKELESKKETQDGLEQAARINIDTLESEKTAIEEGIQAIVAAMAEIKKDATDTFLNPDSFVDTGSDNINVLVSDLRLADDKYEDRICLSFVHSNRENATLYQFATWIKNHRGKTYIYNEHMQPPTGTKPELQNEYDCILELIGTLADCWIEPYRIQFTKSVQLEPIDTFIDGEKPEEFNAYKDNSTFHEIYRYTGRLIPMFIDPDDRFYKNYIYRYQQWDNINDPETQRYIRQGKSGLAPDFPSIGYFPLVEISDTDERPAWYTEHEWPWEVSWKNHSVIYEMPEVYTATTSPITPIPYHEQAEEDVMWELLYKYISSCLSDRCAGKYFETTDGVRTPKLTTWMKHKVKEMYNISYNFEYADEKTIDKVRYFVKFELK